MEEAGKDQQVAPSAGKSKQRYQLRSAIKSNAEMPSPKVAPLSSATRRSIPASGLSKSMNVLDLSGKGKFAKPLKRLSIPAKTNGTPAANRIDSMTRISENRPRRSAVSQAKSDTPCSEISKSGMRRQYSRLSTASYWLSQIKLAETAAKHSISLGFFKLALETGCEPQQQMRNELKAYARKHDLNEYEDFVKELFGFYNVTESLEELLVPKNSSEVVQGSIKPSDDEVQSATSSIKSRNLQPKSLNNDVSHAYPAVRSVNKENLQKTNLIARTRGLTNKSSAASKSSTVARSAQKNSEKTNKQKYGKEKAKITEEMKTVNLKDNSGSVTENLEENKENMGSRMPEEELTTVEAM